MCQKLSAAAVFLLLSVGTGNTATAATICFGGANDYMSCTSDVDCPNGKCLTCNGIADCPMHDLVPGGPTYQLYSVPFITNRAGLDTFFACTSLDTTDMQVGVETFLSVSGPPANDVAATSLTVSPGRMVTFATGSALAFSVNSTVFPCGSCDGSARILATSKKLACTAFVADGANFPPTSAWQLTIVAKTKQRGD